MGRIIIFTGKGGVGKSSVATAHALKSAREGKKTLLASTDMAHNLGDIFETRLGKEPVKIDACLDVYEIDPNYVMEHDFREIVQCLDKMLPKTGDSSMDFGMMPGTEELFSLLKIAELQHSGIYDRIIVDCAPTGETLSLLKFPELLSWYMEKFFPVGKVAVRLLSPVSKHLFQVELPNKEAMNDIQRMYLKLMELEELLRNREITSIRLVTLPEKMVVEETKRNYMYMNLYDFNVDGLYINRILPKEMGNDYFTQWQEIQQKYIGQLEESFGMLPIYRIPWYDEELRGKHAVERICQDALCQTDLFEAKVILERAHFEENERGYELRLSVPNAQKGEVDFYQSQTDVVIKLGNFKRNIPLPNILRNYDITAAKLRDGKLNIQFEKEEEA